MPEERLQQTLQTNERILLAVRRSVERALATNEHSMVTEDFDTEPRNSETVENDPDRKLAMAQHDFAVRLKHVIQCHSNEGKPECSRFWRIIEIGME